MRLLSCLLLAAICLPAQTPDAGRKAFEGLCAGCHGADGAGGERGPAIVSSRRGRSRNEQQLTQTIRSGIPAGGMPAFPLPESELQQLAAFIHGLSAPAAENPPAGDVAAGERFFFGQGNCAGCHMVNGRGVSGGPDLSALGGERRVTEIETALREPGQQVASGYTVVSAKLRDGRTLRGFARNESNYDLQLQGLDGALHLLRRDQITDLRREPGSLMPPLQASADQRRDLVAYLSRLSGATGRAAAPGAESKGAIPFADIAQPRPGEWPTYHGNLTGNRHSPLAQITPANVTSLAPRWIFTMQGTQRLEVTPVVADGVMYVTAVNEAQALDAQSGRVIWQFRRARTPGVIGDAGSGINRGVALLGDRVFIVTDNAHILALHRLTGALLWDAEMADSRQHYGSTSAPLVVNDLVLAGVSGGDEGARGFVDAYKASTGERVWRFWSIPARGEPLSETWVGRALEHGCATTWLTGTFDPATNLIFWTTGNPCPDYNGDERKGDNLYSSSVVALDPATGKVRWYYQYTPHDLHDWDAVQTPMLIDATFQGRPRKLLAQANRNGFFYVLDRTNGELLLAKPFVKKMTWATGIGKDGRPQLIPEAVPTPQGVKACPAVEGATNWMSTAYNPATGLFYVMALERCTIYSKSVTWFEQGRSFYGGTTREVPGEKGEKFLRALDLQTGNLVWEYPMTGPGNTWGGVLSTASGLVFFGDDSGALAAVEAKTGKPLWHFHTSQSWKASPMTYLAGGTQYIAVAAGPNILAFAIPR
jgi:PQQ-dependent dehydrogenase (methanol/ethanol family)